MIANHPIYGHNYSYHIRGDRSPLNENEYLDAGWVQKPLHLFFVIYSNVYNFVCIGIEETQL